ncbi:MAG: diguanylate cyclase [Thermodesulfobacteriota bacterium]
MSIRIRTKIIASFTIVLVLLSFLGFVAYYNRNILFRDILNLEAETHEIELLADLQLAIDMVVMPPNDYLITGDKNEMVKYRKTLEKAERAFKRLEGSEAHMGHAGLLKQAKKKFIILKGRAEEIFAIPEPMGNKAGVRLMKEIDALSHDIIMDLSKFHEIEKEEIRAAIASTDLVRKRVDELLAVGIIVSMATVILLVAYLLRSIIKPLVTFKEGAFIIRSGNLDHKIDLKDGVEVNLLVDEFNKMTDKLKESYSGLEKKIEERTRELNGLNEKLLELSITDGLTGAYNHRHFYERLTEEISRAERYGRKVSMIMTDIDHFKNYNDTCGHVEGDTVLKGIASCIMKNVRAQDLVARYGGEEFSIMLPDTDKKVATVLAERIRRCISVQPFPNKETQPCGNLTISLGVAAFPDDAPDPTGLIERADSALYKAKERGRNRVEEA